MSEQRKLPTQKQIDAEIKALRTMKPRVRRSSMFGDDHHAAIDAQIEVLENDLDNSDIDQRYDDGDWPDNVRSSAEEARRWLDGEALDDYEKPSDGWKELVVKP